MMQLIFTIYKLLIIYVVVLTSLVISSTETFAVFSEQLAVDTRAISLGGAVTADPPGMMSAHYNPAGLSLLDDGKIFSNGLTPVHIVRKGTFTPDMDWPGLMNGNWGPHPENWKYETVEEQKLNDPNSDHSGPDPLANTTGENSGKK